MRRGFVATLAAAAFASILLLTIVYSQTAFRERERAQIEYGNAVSVLHTFDSAARTLGIATGINASFYAANSELNATFGGAFPITNVSSNVTAYSAFLQDNLSKAASAQVTANFSNIAGGTVRLYSDSNASFAADYANNSAAVESRTNGGSTGITSVVMTFNTTDALNGTTAWAFDGGGDAVVTLRVQYAGGLLESSGAMDSSAAHEYTVKFGADGSNEIHAFFGNDSNRLGTARLNATNAAGNWTIAAQVPYDSQAYWYYDATLNATKGKVSRESAVYAFDGG